MAYPAISKNSLSFSSESNSFDKKSKIGLGISFLNELNLFQRSVTRLRLTLCLNCPFPWIQLIFLNLRFKVKTRNLTPLGEYDPQLTVVETKRIVGYPAFSDILVYDLDSGSHQVFTSTSTFFASKRNPPVYFGDKEVDIDSFELLEEWQKEVCYGSITFL